MFQFNIIQKCMLRHRHGSFFGSKFKRTIFIVHSSLLVSCVCSCFSRGSEAGAAGEGALFFFGSWQGGMNALLERLVLPCSSFQRVQGCYLSKAPAEWWGHSSCTSSWNKHQLASNCLHAIFQSWQLHRAAQCGTMLKPHHCVFTWLPTSRQKNAVINPNQQHCGWSILGTRDLCHPMPWTWLLFAYLCYGYLF